MFWKIALLILVVFVVWYGWRLVQRPKPAPKAPPRVTLERDPETGEYRPREPGRARREAERDREPD